LEPRFALWLLDINFHVATGFLALVAGQFFIGTSALSVMNKVVSRVSESFVATEFTRQMALSEQAIGVVLIGTVQL
jgi:hypothetical protein